MLLFELLDYKLTVLKKCGVQKFLEQIFLAQDLSLWITIKIL